MFERFTDDARRGVVLAQEQARLLNHQHIGTEHLLLGLLVDENDETAIALRAVGVTGDQVRHRLERSPGRGRREPSGHIPFTARMKRVLQEAHRASLTLGRQNSIGLPHLLRGLLEVRDSLGCRLLVELGVDLDALALTAEELAVQDAPPARGPADRLADQRDVLARGLLRYGRHDDECDPSVGCSCGLAELLELAQQGQGEQP
ncbi:MAG: Clp protease N-terminal domain-containing protein [Jatrophihabitantaceae bacterium]